ncbi:putative uncharacterized protein DDB_G0271982 isoform X3 [Prorops nasuta]|uniref:putative uncharacterized protein DDB_G0271982 isoform X3 n=1 Tax=Prorops nasuta TaxID=863751 RepID=UPI0034CDAB9F
MTGRISLVEQKRIQWAQEREEMARLSGNWGPLKPFSSTHTSIRTYPLGTRVCLERKDKQGNVQLRASGHYGSTTSLRSLATESSGNLGTSLKSFDYSSGSLNDLSQPETDHSRRRSPSLPPIYTKDHHQYNYQERDYSQPAQETQKLREQQLLLRNEAGKELSDPEKHRQYSLPNEEREGETSGYASDSVDPPVPRYLPGGKPASEMNEKTWQNPYYTTSESSLPPSRMLSANKIGELNRPRWGSIWAQDTSRGDPPPPSWLARLGHSSQVLVINHDSASSPDSSTTGSTGSESKTYLRGQNIPLNPDILHEREARRQKALDLQNAIKQQLEEKERQRKADIERKLREEKLEEERIQREREKERERFEEEQRRLKQKEDAKLRQAETMREVLEVAERLAKEQKKNRLRRREKESLEEPSEEFQKDCKSSFQSPDVVAEEENQGIHVEKGMKETEPEELGKEKLKMPENSEEKIVENVVQVPVSKEVAIVLSGRLEDSDLLNKANLQLVNLVVTPSPRRDETGPNSLTLGLNALMKGFEGSVCKTPARLSPRIVENRLLTPSKYRIKGRDFGTQTDVESDLQESREKSNENKENSTKDRKEAANNNRRDIEKSTNNDEVSMKSISRSKSQARTSLEGRPRWNANRPGTRYRTQSEKDPHYQRRLRLRRRQIDSSDEGSRSPSPDRSKLTNGKSKIRGTIRRKVKPENYDADLSMDSMNSVVPLRVDKNGRINLDVGRIGRRNKLRDRIAQNQESDCTENAITDVWCGQEILQKLSSLRNGLLVKQMEWDPDQCSPVSPETPEIF